MRKSNSLLYKGYVGKVEFDSEAKVFYGRIINTRDTIEPLAKLLPFVVRYLTTNGNSTRCSCKSPFALRYRRVKRTFARGSITFQSDDAKRLEDEFRFSIDTYLSYCAELGEAPEKPYSGRLVLRLSPEEYRAVVLAATLANKSPNKWVAEHLVRNAQKELQQ